MQVIEAAYRPAEGDEAWLRGLLEALRPCMDDGLGICGYFIDASRRGGLLRAGALGIGCTWDWRAAFDSLCASPPEHALAWQLSMPPHCTVVAASRRVPERVQGDRERLFYGFVDWERILAIDPTGLGVVVAAPLRRVGALAAREAAVGARVAAHIAAGFRLRRQERATLGALDGVDAIVDPSGHVVEARRAAAMRHHRAALRDAVVSIRRAGTRLRWDDPDEAVATWRGLVAGMWSLVDHFDHDGRRFFVARRNDPAGAGSTVLSARERQVIAYAALGHANKLIAYELGLSPTTVASHLASAARKLGVRSRAALIRAVLASGAGER